MRGYKETPLPAGVYRVVHQPSQRVLLGVSPDVPAMFNRIRAQLAMSSYPNRQLQSDWDTDGEESFEFESLDLLAPPDDPTQDINADLRTLLEL